MALNIEYTNQFKRDLKKAKKQNKNLNFLKKIMEKIQHQEELPKKLHQHILTGNWKDHHELHLAGDWLLIYKLIPKENTVIFVRIGSHSELFC